MILIFTDGSGYQEYPATSDQAHFVLRDPVAIERIKAGEGWRLNSARDGVEFEAAAEREARELAQAQAQAETEIDSAAQAVRLAYVSPGKDATYQQKAAELARYESEGGAGGPYPYIEAEATARGVSLATVAGEIAQARDVWGQIDPQIEAMSRAGKVKAQAATTAQAVREAVAEALANLEGLKP